MNTALLLPTCHGAAYDKVLHPANVTNVEGLQVTDRQTEVRKRRAVEERKGEWAKAIRGENKEREREKKSKRRKLIHLLLIGFQPN